MNPDTYVGPGTGGGIKNPALGENLNSLLDGGGVSFFNSLLPRIVSVVLVVGVIIFFFMLLFGAIQWISSGGDKASLEGARGKITSAIVGLIVLFATFAIVSLIETFFGIDILTLDIGSLLIQ